MSQKAKWERTEVGHVTLHHGNKDEMAEVTTTTSVEVNRTVKVRPGPLQPISPASIERKVDPGSIEA